jgi:NADP-dependent 3-hydroxy acid dehydrogenase YdfG
MVKSMLFDLTGKVGIVTGSGRGLGKTIAIGLAECGAKVVTCSRNITEAEATAKEVRDHGGEAFSIRVDTSVRTECQALMDETLRRYGKVDIMVCNAGVSAYTAAEDVEEEEWNRMMDINLRGYFNCAQLAARQMLKQEAGGSIIMNSSNNSLVGYPGLMSYATSKGVGQSGHSGQCHQSRLDGDEHERRQERPGEGERDKKADTDGAPWICKRAYRTSCFPRLRGVFFCFRH